MGRTRTSLILLLAAFVMLPATAMAKVELVVIAYPGEGDRAWLEQTKQSFEEATPGVTVRLEYHGDWNWVNEMTTWLAAGTAPDVFHAWFPRQRIWAEQGLLLDLDPYVEVCPDWPEYFQTVWDAVFVPHPGIRSGAPFDIAVNAVFYNETLFQEAGLSYPDDDWTWADLTRLARKLTVRDHTGDTVQWGFSTYFHSLNWLATWVHGAGGYFFDLDDPRQFLGDSPEAINGLQYLFKMMWEDQSAALDAFGGFTRFLNGSQAMWHGSNQQAKTMYDTAGLDWNVVPNPIGPGGKRGTFLHQGGLSISATTKHPNEAFTFVKYALSHENLGLLQELTWRLAPLPDVAVGYLELAPDKNMKAFLVDVDNSILTVASRMREPDKIQELLQTPLRAAYEQGRAPSLVIREVASAVRAVLEAD